MKKTLLILSALSGVVSLTANSAVITSVDETVNCATDFSDSSNDECIVIDTRNGASNLAQKINTSNYRTFYFKPGTYVLEDAIYLDTFSVNKKPMKFAGIAGQQKPVITGKWYLKKLFKAKLRAATERQSPGSPLYHQYYTFENLDLRLSCAASQNVNQLTSCGILEFTPFRALVRNNVFRSQYGYCMKHKATGEKRSGYGVALESRYENNHFRCQYSQVTEFDHKDNYPRNSDGSIKYTNSPTDNFYIGNHFEITSSYNANDRTTPVRGGLAFIGYSPYTNSIGSPGIVGALVKNNSFDLYHQSQITQVTTDSFSSYINNTIDITPKALNVSTGSLEHFSGVRSQKIFALGGDWLTGAMQLNNNTFTSSHRISPLILSNSHTNSDFKVNVYNNTEHVRILCQRAGEPAQPCNNTTFSR